MEKRKERKAREMHALITENLSLETQVTPTCTARPGQNLLGPVSASGSRTAAPQPGVAQARPLTAGVHAEQEPWLLPRVRGWEALNSHPSPLGLGF